jgi:hypothetical protein
MSGVLGAVASPSPPPPPKILYPLRVGIPARKNEPYYNDKKNRLD